MLKARLKKQNMMCPGQKTNSKEFDENFNRIFRTPERCAECSSWSEVLGRCYQRECYKSLDGVEN